MLIRVEIGLNFSGANVCCAVSLSSPTHRFEFAPPGELRPPYPLGLDPSLPVVNRKMASDVGKRQAP
jgi:hypothetical protein